MKLAAAQLSQHLAKTLATIYVVSGDDTLLVQEACDLIREAAVKAGFLERVRINVEQGADWGQSLYSHAQSLSLFANKQLLELDLTTAKLNAASSKILQEYAQRPPADTILVIRANKLDSKAEQSSWYKSLDKAAVIIPLWPIPIEQLPAWILQRAKKLNINLSKSGADFLAAQVEGNLLAAAQELEKLRLLSPTDVIDEKTIESAVMDNAQFDIFTLIDSALAGNSKRSLRILENLAAEDTEPTIVLWAIARELRTMAELAKQVQQGVSLGALFPKYRIWEKRQPHVRAFLQRHKQEKCWELLANAAQIDRMIKGAETGNVWNKFENVIISICINSNKP